MEILEKILPIFILAMLIEAIIYRVRKKKFPYLEAGVSLVMTGLYVAQSPLSRELIKPFNSWLLEHSLFTIEASPLTWVLAFLGVEFFYYWTHRLGHEIRWFWASHSVHHSPVTMTLSGAYRLAITNIISGVFVIMSPLFLIGFPFEMVGPMLAINLGFQFLLHTELIPPLGFLEKIFNTPSNHRVHHAINPEYIDKNYGGVLVIYDILFGTYTPENRDIPIEYGVIGKPRSLNPLYLFVREWIAMAKDVASSKKLAFIPKFMFGRPGWKPDPLSEDEKEELLQKSS